MTAIAETVADAPGSHAWMEATVAASDALSGVAEVPGWSLRDTQILSLTDSATRLVAQAEAMRARIVAEAARRSLPEAAGSPSVAAWLRARQGLSPRAARQVQSLADGLYGPAEAAGGHRMDAVAAALQAGEMHAEQAAAAGQVLGEAPESTDRDTKADAERMLVDYASRIDAVGLRRMDAHLWAALDPAADDADVARRLAAQESRAAARRRLSFTRYGDGSTGIAGCLPDADAALVKKALDPLAKPCPASDGEQDPRTPTQRNADALVDLAHRALDTGMLPQSGGQATQVVVTVDEHADRGALDDGTELSPDATSWLACDAELIWAIRNSEGLVTRLGRTQRYFTGGARRAVIIRDGGCCAFPGCDRPASWCHVHHIVRWKDGGATDLDNGVLLCGWHHRLVHHTDTWSVISDTDGHPSFIPPPWVDPKRQPLRNSHAPPPPARE